MLRKFVHENFEGYLQEKFNNKPRYSGFLGRVYKYTLRALGLYLDPKRDYFIEEEVPDIDMTKIQKIFQDRMIDLLSACLGVAVIIGSVLKNFLLTTNLTPEEAKFIFVGIVGFSTLISPVLVGWLIPVIWTLQDSAIREVTDRNTVREVSMNVRNGLLNRLLGFAGFIGGISLLMDVGPQISDDPLEGNVVIFIFALLALMLVVFIISGPAYLIGILYFTRDHERNVNILRFSLFRKGLPLGMTMVRNANEEEIQRFNEIGKQVLEALEKRDKQKLSPKEDGHE